MWFLRMVLQLGSSVLYKYAVLLHYYWVNDLAELSLCSNNRQIFQEHCVLVCICVILLYSFSILSSHDFFRFHSRLTFIYSFLSSHYFSRFYTCLPSYPFCHPISFLGIICFFLNLWSCHQHYGLSARMCCEINIWFTRTASNALIQMVQRPMVHRWV